MTPNLRGVDHAYLLISFKFEIYVIIKELFVNREVSLLSIDTEI